MSGPVVGRRAVLLEQLLAFAARSRVERGFGHLRRDGSVDADGGLELWVNARMTYVFSVASLLGVPGVADLARHGVEALVGPFEDRALGGWWSALDTDGRPVEDTKSCYDHAFVVLAAATAHGARVPGAEGLLGRALAVHEERFWDEPRGLCVDQWSGDWSRAEDYRGANSCMHTVEAYLVAADATGDRVWCDRALRIAEHLVDAVAREHRWRVVEHFDADWRPLPEHHRDRPADPFRPYGATPGHGLEWARLLTHLHAAHEVAGDPPPAWLLEAAAGLFDRAAADADEGRGGFPYTTDWAGEAVVDQRFHWVHCEAVLAAHALERATGEARYADLAGRWWDFTVEHFVEPDGSWLHELGPDLAPADLTWPGKPDAYHAFNALLLPSLPLAPSAAVALR
ncbi:AGE family epimerase/isomerase [Nocardioides sp. SOB77]|uniref:AGE family epimerase/isomerase n=1 Tax=Nocardioides oceani TaxID=3058369 RepID=A0ABT8FEM2_9ACTN|nr:AGE family epimerase/isomerase [Nocardioides oceani]MDN4172877.1 AGE family epimerase/isomerase [Nocardioides oceani]